MRQYLFQSAVDFIVLLLGLVLVTVVAVIRDGRTVAPEYDWSLVPAVVAFSVVLTAVHWFGRPLLVIVFGGWLMRSFGLFALILDIFLFAVAVFLAPVQFQTTSTPWWSIVVAAVLYNLLGFIIGTLVGVNRPRPDGKRTHEALWRQLERLSSVRRNWISEKVRLQEVSDTFLTYGLEIALADTSVGQLRRWVTHRVYGRSNQLDDLSTPEKLRVMLQQLGPTYVKFGQMASSQSETLPSDWATELAKLQSDVPPVPYEQARDVIISDLGRPPEELYATFEHDPLAAASTAQVHRATLHDGTPVAVKVQRPNIVATVKADLGVLSDVSSVVENVSSYARDLDLSGIVTEFGDGVIRELDYHNEAYHALRLADNMRALPSVHVPTVYQDLSTARVLTMEFVNGVKVNNLGALDRLGVDRVLLMQAFLRAMIKQIFIDGFFHGDPHPGNIVFDLDTGALTYLDFGLVGRLDQTRRLELIDLVVSVHQNDAASLANLALRLTKKTRPVDVDRFRGDMIEMLNQYLRYAPYPMFNTVVNEFFALLQRYGLRLDKQFTLAVKTVVQSQAVVNALGGDVEFVAFAVQEIRSLGLAEITQDKVLDTLKQQVTQVGKELLRSVPNLQDATISWLSQYMQGKLIVNIDTHELTEQVDGLNATFTRLTAGLVITGMIIGTAIVITQLWQVGDGQRVLPYIAMIVFVVLLFVGLRLIWRTLHPPRRPYVE
jgi:ubiquinone biosynthesis protein